VIIHIWLRIKDDVYAVHMFLKHIFYPPLISVPFFLIIVTVLLLSVLCHLLRVPKINGMFHKLDLFVFAGAWWGMSTELGVGKLYVVKHNCVT